MDRGVAFDDPALAWLWGGPLPTSARSVGAVAWLADPEGDLARRLHDAGVSPCLVVSSRSLDPGCHCARYLVDSLAPLTGARRVLDCRPLRVEAQRSDEILVHPGSGAARKNWPAARFAATVETLRRRGAAVRLLVGEADVGAAAAVEAHVGTPMARLEHPSLRRLAAVLAGSRGYLGNDSGVSHLAGLVGAHTVTTFGPTAPAVWRPIGPDVTVLPFDAGDEAVVAALLRTGGD